MDNVYIIGLGMLRFNKYPDLDVRKMAHEVTRLALEDAGLEKDALEAAFFSNTFWGMFDNQHSIRGQVVLRSMGIEAIPVTNVENACAGASTALHMAYTGIRAGMYDVALALGSEKITNPDKALSLSAYATCMDVGNFENHLKMMEEINQKLNFQIPADQTPPGEGRSIFMDAYAMGARWHMKAFGSTQEQLALICAKKSLARFPESHGPVPGGYDGRTGPSRQAHCLSFDPCHVRACRRRCCCGHHLLREVLEEIDRDPPHQNPIFSVGHWHRPGLGW